MLSMSEEKQNPPMFGHHLGFWYPLAWRILASNKYWSPSMWLPKDSALAIDIYLGVWWFIELFTVVFCGLFFQWKGLQTWIFVFIVLFRFIDLMFVLTSILVKGNYRRIGDWPSLNRITLLVILNVFEIMFIFAILYRALGVLLPGLADTAPVLKNFFEAFYFSVVTGTTLGYGIPHPVGFLSRTLSMIEGTSVLLLVITVISYITGGKRKPEDKEHKTNSI